MHTASYWSFTHAFPEFPTINCDIEVDGVVVGLGSQASTWRRGRGAFASTSPLRHGRHHDDAAGRLRTVVDQQSPPRSMALGHRQGRRDMGRQLGRSHPRCAYASPAALRTPRCGVDYARACTPHVRCTR